MLTIEFFQADDGAILAHAIQTDLPATVGVEAKPSIAHVVAISSSRDFGKLPSDYTILLDKVEAQRMFAGMCVETVTHHRRMGRFHARLRG